MGLLEKLLAEAKAEAATKPESPVKPISQQATQQEQSDYHENYRKKHEEERRKRLEWEAAQDQDYRIEHVWKCFDALTTISCPVCKADRGEPCGEVEGEFGATYLPYQYRKKDHVHQGRMRTFGVTQGLHVDDLKKEPYRTWPYASRYRRWAIFKTSCSGGETKLHKKCVKKLRIFDNPEAARARAEKAQQESTAKHLKETGSSYGGDRFDIAPVVKVNDQWIRYDLAQQEQEEKGSTPS